MTSTRLIEIYSLFEQHKFATAFHGDSTFFLKDDAWGLHNNTAMFMHYIDWVNKKEDNKYLDLLKAFFEMDLSTNRSLNKISNELAPIALLRFYCHAAFIKKSWPITKSEILIILAKVEQIFTKEEKRQFHIYRDLEGFLKWIPEIEELIPSIRENDPN